MVKLDYDSHFFLVWEFITRKEKCREELLKIIY